MVKWFTLGWQMFLGHRVSGCEIHVAFTYTKTAKGPRRPQTLSTTGVLQISAAQRASCVSVLRSGV